MEKKLELGQEILAKMEEAASAEIVAYKNAKKRLEDLELKQGDYSTRIESLKTELNQTFQNANNVEEGLQARRAIQKELADDEELLIAIDQHFLPPAKIEWQNAGGKVVGHFFTVLDPIKQSYQKKLNEIFEDANEIIESFDLEVPQALRALIGGDLSPFGSPSHYAILRQFDLSLAPEDPFKLRLARASVLTAMSLKKTWQ
jgi:hypothetical protein